MQEQSSNYYLLCPAFINQYKVGSYLAVERKVSASTQNQALSAILFLYCEVLKVDLAITTGMFLRTISIITT